MDLPERYEYEDATLIIENDPSPEAVKQFLRIIAKMKAKNVECEREVGVKTTQ